jgi:hypothetical protein
LLTANREDIDNSIPWNRTLFEASVDAFIAAVDYFNSGPQHYVWPRYLPIAQEPDIFGKFRSAIINRLAELPVLESCSGTMLKPSSLTYVPSRFIDNKRKPLTLGRQTKNKYLSSDYPLWEIGPICALGVKEMQPEDFLQDLSSIIVKDRHKFRNQSEKWHSKLAKTLLQLAVEGEHKLIISALDIIPLRDGSWVSAQGRTIFFSEKVNGLDIPKEIPVLVVDPMIKLSCDRRDLFMKLGVRSCQDTEICRLIRNKHSEPVKPTPSLREQLIPHAVFLFKASFHVLDNSELWFVSNRNVCYRGSELYVGRSFANMFSPEFFERFELKCPFLHKAYVDAVKHHERAPWISWLCDTFNLSRLPRLIYPSIGSSFNVSDDFKFIMEECQVSDVLKMLIDNWDHYETWIEGKDPKKESAELRASKDRVRAELERTEVRCGARKVPLGNTFLPLIDLNVDTFSYLPALDIQKPKDRRWQKLANLGIAVKKDAHFYLLCLEHMQNSNPTFEEVSSIYHKLQIYSEDNEELVK